MKLNLVLSEMPLDALKVALTEHAKRRADRITGNPLPGDQANNTFLAGYHVGYFGALMALDELLGSFAQSTGIIEFEPEEFMNLFESALLKGEAKATLAMGRAAEALH